MIEGAINNVSTNKQNPYLSMDVFLRVPVYLQTGMRGSKMQTDNVELTSKQKMSKSKKTLLAIGGIAAAALGTVLAVKGYRSHQITKSLERIEQTFSKLQENIPEVQKTFKDVFLRDDITEKETLEMLNRYKEVEKIGVTGTKEEYIQAMFREARNNFKIDISPSTISAKIVNEPIMGNERILGFTDPLGWVSIRSNIEHQYISDVIHHELRHLKQRIYSFNLSPDEYVSFNQPTNMTIPKKMFELHLGGKADISKIPPEHMEFAEKSRDGMIAYKAVTDDEIVHYAQWVEDDAHKTGQKMAKLLGYR